MNKPRSTKTVDYHPSLRARLKENRRSIRPIGVDTEADRSGRCFMICTSLGDTFVPSESPACWFSRKYRGQHFVAYNLKYDEGALLQGLPLEELRTLWETGRCQHGMYTYRSIPRKMLVISKGKNSVHFWDMYNFYLGSLDYNARLYLGESKLDLDVTLFEGNVIYDAWDYISFYCRLDAVLVQRLAERIIGRFESLGVYPTALYSIAYVSFEHFRRTTPYVTARRFWEWDRAVLDAAMASYQGGKFEVTEKGVDYYYEYDLSSAYPYEISRLVDIREARVIGSTGYLPDATYGFLDCSVTIPQSTFSPVVLLYGATNTYPVGSFRRWITLEEYRYLVSAGAEVEIHRAWYLVISKRDYPYREEIQRLYRLKQEYKADGEKLDYHTVKILLNSLYGKMVQLIQQGERWRAGTSWNPIYGAIITANVRIRVSEMQARHRSVVAVHTDSVISTQELPYGRNDNLGDWQFETAGHGCVLGTGVYQIGDRNKFRGFDTGQKLSQFFDIQSDTVRIDDARPYTWREVAFHNWSTDLINKFVDLPKELHVRFDRKRLWMEDYRTFADVPKRKVLSLPLVASSLFGYRTA